MHTLNAAMFRLLLSLIVVGMLLFLTRLDLPDWGVRRTSVLAVPVAVASNDLPTGTTLTMEDIKIVGWPPASPVEGSFATREAIVDRRLTQSVVAHEPLTESKLAPLEADTGLLPSSPLGMRAVSVRVNDVIGVAGVPVPGARVDILLTMTSGNDRISRAIVSNVQVLTAGQLYNTKIQDGRGGPSTVVTLLLTPEDAERVTLAQAAGSIMLTLRNPLDIAPSNSAIRQRVRPIPLPTPKPPHRFITDPPMPPRPPPTPAGLKHGRGV